METRRILLGGVPTTVERDGEELVAPDGGRIPAAPDGAELSATL